MTRRPPHINLGCSRLPRVAGALLASTVVALVVGVAPGHAGSAYGYPVKPFHAEHPVRGNFGDPRTLFSAPPTTQGLLTGGGSFQFHFGVDISASDGTAVYPVASGTVTMASSDRREVVVSSGDGRAFEYWHIHPAVRVGQSVTAEATVLGRIVHDAKHVHLTELAGGVAVNPLQSGHLTPYNHSTAPRIASIRVGQAPDALALPNFVRGTVELVAQVEDTPNMPVPGIWRDMPVAPALVTWRLVRPGGATVLGPYVAADFRRTIPGSGAFWQVYARGSFQNMCVFGNHYSWLQPGRYLYRLAQGPFDTTRVKDGVYELVVTASDVRGHSSTESLRITIHNRPGWSGS